MKGMLKFLNLFVNFNLSTSGNEYTDVYGSDRQKGNFTPFIADCFKPNVKSCILDGEMVGYHAETKTIGNNSVWNSYYL